MDPIYIPSRGRSATASTHRHFEVFGHHDWTYVVEPHDQLNYIRMLMREGIDNPFDHVYVFDVDTYKEPYDPVDNPKGYNYFDDLGWKPGLTTGPGPARNAIHDLARERGQEHYYMMDDDILNFGVDAFFFQKSVYTTVGGKISTRIHLVKMFELFERWLDKYENVGLAEFEKAGMAMNHRKNTHIATNCKTYSCIRIPTFMDSPWEGRYNDDVCASLNVLRKGYVNVSSKLVGYQTPETQQQAGGMTEAFASIGGTFDKVAYLLKAYPDVSRMALKFGRIHHQVSYLKYNKNPLIFKDGVSLDDLVFHLEDACQTTFDNKEEATEKFLSTMTTEKLR